MSNDTSAAGTGPGRSAPLLVTLCVLACARALAAAAPACDLLFAGGRVVDGTGAPWFTADVCVVGDRIAAVGQLAGASAKRRIDASRLVVAPGFIDMMGQSEYTRDDRGDRRPREGCGALRRQLQQPPALGVGQDRREPRREVFRIAREARIPAQVYHLKTANKRNWGRMPAVLKRLEQARAEGLDVSADQYPYTAGQNGVDANLPLWVREGGRDKMLARLQDPAIRARIKAEILKDDGTWENQYLDAGGASRILVVSVVNTALKKHEGKTLEQIAREEGRDPLDALMDLVVADRGNSSNVMFMMDEDDVRTALRHPFVSLCTDSSAVAADGIFSEERSHPRAWGSATRILGTYVRDEKLLPLEEAIRKMTGRAGRDARPAGARCRRWRLSAAHRRARARRRRLRGARRSRRAAEPLRRRAAARHDHGDRPHGLRHRRGPGSPVRRAAARPGDRRDRDRAQPWPTPTDSATRTTFTPAGRRRAGRATSSRRSWVPLPSPRCRTASRSARASTA